MNHFNKAKQIFNAKQSIYWKMIISKDGKFNNEFKMFEDFTDLLAYYKINDKELENHFFYFRPSLDNKSLIFEYFRISKEKMNNRLFTVYLEPISESKFIEKTLNKQIKQTMMEV